MDFRMRGSGRLECVVLERDGAGMFVCLLLVEFDGVDSRARV